MRDLNSLYVNGGSNVGASARSWDAICAGFVIPFSVVRCGFEEDILVLPKRYRDFNTPFDTVSADKLEKTRCFSIQGRVGRSDKS